MLRPATAPSSGRQGRRQHTAKPPSGAEAHHRGNSHDKDLWVKVLQMLKPADLTAVRATCSPLYRLAGGLRDARPAISLHPPAPQAPIRLPPLPRPRRPPPPSPSPPLQCAPAHQSPSASPPSAHPTSRPRRPPPPSPSPPLQCAPAHQSPSASPPSAHPTSPPSSPAPAPTSFPIPSFAVRARPSVSIRQPPKRPSDQVRARPSISIRVPPKRPSDFPSFLARAGPALSALTILPTAQLPATCLTLIGQHCPGLVTLNLTDQKGVTDAVLAAVGGGCVGLKTLKVKVHHGKLSQGLEAIAANCRMLETLSLPTQVRESSLGPLLSSFPHLARLDLSWSTKLADPAFATIASCCPRLQHLDASFSQISHIGLAYLAAHCPALSSLRLNACHAVRPPLCLPVLARLPSLQSLDLGQNPLLPDWIEGIISLQAGVCGGKDGSGGKDRAGAAAGTTRLAGFPRSASAPAAALTAATPASASTAAAAAAAAAAAGAASSAQLLPALRMLTAYFQANQTIRATWIESLTLACPALRRINFGTTSRILLSPTPSSTTTTLISFSSSPTRPPHPCSLTLVCPSLRRINFGTTSRILLSPTPSNTNAPLTTSSSSSSAVNAVNALPGAPTSTPSPSSHRRILTPRSPGIFSRLVALASPRAKLPEGTPGHAVPPLESLVLPCFGMSDTVISSIASACPSLTSLRFDPGSKKRYAKILGMFQVAGAPDIDCTVTDASLQSLAASCPSLSELHLFSDYLLGTRLSSHSPAVPTSTPLSPPPSPLLTRNPPPSSSSSSSLSPLRDHNASPSSSSLSSSPSSSPLPSKPPYRFLSLKVLSITSCSLADPGVACIVTACPNLLKLLLRDCIQVNQQLSDFPLLADSAALSALTFSLCPLSPSLLPDSALNVAAFLP
ncbi:unnamed protein product [Closterium sp. Naga37s-1]|nr:unnamed protein product [Closterium sp. Naga37s-1]